MEHTLVVFILLIGMAVAVTAISKVLKQPYPIALVVVGACIGLTNVNWLEPLNAFVTRDNTFNFIIIQIFLPALLGEASLKLSFFHLKNNRKPILLLSVGCTILSFLIVGFTSNLILGVSLQVALVFAALMSATDPVSVLSIFKTMGVDHKLSTIVEGESLLNDGVAVVLFNIAAFSLLDYQMMGWTGIVMGALQFIKVIVGGLMIGGILGWFSTLLTKFYDDYALEITFSIVLFYGAYVIAEYFQVSGVIAVVTAGLVFGNYGSKNGMSPAAKMNINSFWDVLALLANSVVFLMVGLEIGRINFLEKWQFIGLAILIVLVARSISVYVSLLPVRGVPMAWKHIINWGGLKGSLSIALVLSLPEKFPGREMILLLAFSNVLFSLLVQGLTVKPFVSFFGLVHKPKGTDEYEKQIIKLHRYKMAVEKLKEMRREALISPLVFEKAKIDYEKKIETCNQTLEQLYEKNPQLYEEQMQIAIKQSLLSEYEAIEDLSKRQIVSVNVIDEQKTEVINLLEKE